MKLAFLAVLALAMCAGTTSAAPVAASCDARPVVEQFFAALRAGDVDRLDALFGTEEQGWKWYSVSDRAGQRLGAASMRRASLRAYFAARIARHEEIRLVRLDEGGNGNFGMLVERRADDLGDGRWVKRGGKGWVSCTTGTINVWSLGGAPAPASFGPCPREALALPAALEPARRAVLSFLRTTLVEMVPGLDLRNASVSAARPAPGRPEAYTARVRCGLAVQRRTAVVLVTFPHVGATESLHSAAFYVSRLPGRWLVWRLIPLG